MGIEEILKFKRQEILDLAGRHGAYDIRVFGSVARGESRSDSDVDFLVKTSESTSPWFPAGLALDLETILQRRVDIVTERSLHWYIRDRILKEAVPL
jgi:predicted nucleotidyltransferase